MDSILVAGIWYIVFLLSTTLHEASHAYVAMLGGDNTAYNGGQVTLDPIPHIKREPWGMVLIPLYFLFSTGWVLGWASAPYDPIWAKNNHRKAALMAAAGPAANLFLVIISGIIIKVGLMQGFFIPSSRIGYDSLIMTTNQSFSGFATMFSIIFTLNFILFLYNLMPFPPLDGSTIITLFMNEEMAEKYSNFMMNPILMAFGVFFALIGFQYIFNPLYIIVINILL